MKNPFSGLSNLSVREEVITKLSDLERIISIEEELIEKYKTNELFNPFNPHAKLKQGQVLLAKDAQEKTEGMSITSNLLCQYVLARNNPEKNKEAWIRGLYSGFLLNDVCEKNEENKEIIEGLNKEKKGKQTITFDGKNNCFNYLFAFAKNVKNLFLENIEGVEILAWTGSYNGKAEKIFVKNVKGSGLLFCAGSDGGSVEQVSIQNIVGNGTLYYGGRNGKIRQIVLSEIKGYNTLYHAGRSGIAEHITACNISGNNTLGGLACEGGIAKHITMQNIKGELTLYAAGSFNSDLELFCKDKKEGDIEYCVLKDIIGNTICKCVTGTKKFYFGNLEDLDPPTKGKKYTESDNLFLLENNISSKKKDILEDIFLIADSIHTYSLDEQTDLQAKIADLQKDFFE